MIYPGRNEPCHCGSGKKYKKCHLAADERSRAAEAQSASVELPDSGLNLKELTAEYASRGREIAVAFTALEAHRAEFEKVADDQLEPLATALFAEECFSPLRFSASDIERAFTRVGFPELGASDRKMAETIRAAVLCIADESRRTALSMKLLLLLPQFVAAGRYVDGCLIQLTAAMLLEPTDAPNPFLFQMFVFGYQAFVASKQEKDWALLQKVGLTREQAEAMSPATIDEWAAAQQQDPEKARLFAEFLESNPSIREESIKNLQAMEQNSIRLFEREDSRCLYLQGAELTPWLRSLDDRVSQPDFQAKMARADGSEKRKQELFRGQVLPLLERMAGEIFTSDRRLQLVEDLKRYRNERFAAGDAATAKNTMGAIISVENEADPAKNPFLISLCWASISQAIRATEPEAV